MVFVEITLGVAVICVENLIFCNLASHKFTHYTYSCYVVCIVGGHFDQ